MKLLNRRPMAVYAGIGLTSVAVLAARLVWGQAAPVLGISLTGTNAIVLTVTNGVSTGQYQIYWTEFLIPDAEWWLLTNGSAGQTQFVASMSDLDQAFFQAAANTNFMAPTLSVIILSPTNGMVLQ